MLKLDSVRLLFFPSTPLATTVGERKGGGGKGQHAPAARVPRRDQLVQFLVQFLYQPSRLHLLILPAEKIFFKQLIDTDVMSILAVLWWDKTLKRGLLIDFLISLLEELYFYS